jgi:anti-sigma factor RsiW
VVTSCEEVRALLADFVCSRLAPEQRRLVEQHRQTCPECGEIVADLEIMKKQIQGSGEAMFEPHPEPLALHLYVLEEGGGEAGPIGRHLETCASCQLEVETWKRIGRKKAPAPAATARGRMPVPWLALAAGLGGVVGLLIGWRLLSAPAPVRPETAPPRAALPGTPTPPVLSAPVIHLLPPLLRSGKVPLQHWSLDADEPYLAVTVPLSLPAEAAGTDRFRFELRPAGGEPV